MNNEKVNIVNSKEQIIAAFIPLFKSNGIKSAVLFGSFAKGKENAESDIDLLVESNLEGFAFLNFVAELEDVCGREVDCFDVRHIDNGSKIKDEINRTGVLVYEN